MDNLTKLPYDTSWADASNGWPTIKGYEAYAMYVFANCADSIPYGTYVLMEKKGAYGADDHILRVHPDYIEQLKQDFRAEGSPTPDESEQRRELTEDTTSSGRPAIKDCKASKEGFP